MSQPRSAQAAAEQSGRSRRPLPAGHSVGGSGRRRCEQAVKDSGGRGTGPGRGPLRSRGVRALPEGWSRGEGSSVLGTASPEPLRQRLRDGWLTGHSQPRQWSPRGPRLPARLPFLRRCLAASGGTAAARGSQAGRRGCSREPGGRTQPPVPRALPPRGTARLGEDREGRGLRRASPERTARWGPASLIGSPSAFTPAPTPRVACSACDKRGHSTV